jgi:hypothetical protein
MRAHLIAGVLLAACAVPGAATAQTPDFSFPITSFSDFWDDLVRGDTNCQASEGPQCSLRMAIQEANALGQQDPSRIIEIVLPQGTYVVQAVAGHPNGAAGDDAAESGDLDVTSTIILRGDGADTTTIEAGGDGQEIDRVFHVLAGGDLTLEDVSVRSGRAVDPGTDSGGGILNRGTLVLTRSALVDNEADVGAGLYTDGTATVVDSTFEANNASAGAASGIHAESGSLTVENSTLSAELDTALRSVDALTALTHVTIQGAAGNGLAASPSTNPVTIETSLVVGSGVADCAFSGSPALILPNGGTLDSDASCAAGGFALTAPNPLLGSLALNGGSTENHEPQAGSAAIDSAVFPDCLPFDQRGLARPDGVGGVGFCDIGSVEVLPEPAALPLGLAGLALVGALARRKRR